MHIPLHKYGEKMGTNTKCINVGVYEAKLSAMTFAMLQYGNVSSNTNHNSIGIYRQQSQAAPPVVVTEHFT